MQIKSCTITDGQFVEANFATAAGDVRVEAELSEPGRSVYITSITWCETGADAAPDMWPQLAELEGLIRAVTAEIFAEA